MKSFYAFLLLAVVLFTVSSCKKSSPVTPQKPNVDTQEHVVNDSVSFTINGKRYTNLLNPPSFTLNEFGNRGTNLKPSNTPGDWYIGRGNTYWVGNADSVQYYSAYTAVLQNNEGVIKFSFIKNNSRANMLKLGSFYLPKMNEDFYTLGKNKYATDFEREGKEQGIAISFGDLKSNTQAEIFDKPTITAEDQTGSTFKILKIEDVKGVELLRGMPSVIIEASFEANLFDKDKNPIKITNGFLRFTAIKYGNRWSISN
nr:hypothetical protein [Mucilaginibacter sp. L294]